MFDILKSLFWGNIAPAEKFGIQNPEFKKATAKMYETRESLTVNFTEEQQKLLEIYDDKCSELSAITSEDAFISGFSLAIKLITESYESRY